jgi:hypothetical protein
MKATEQQLDRGHITDVTTHGILIDVIYSIPNDCWSFWYDGNMIKRGYRTAMEAINALDKYIELNGL